ncbi:MAG: 4Fe-4S binding protein [Oscillospiraceae bacterium]|nr:4Fe-4S binding protein [Oscillospiraceae bacterium]
MNEIMIVKPEKCVGCNACIRSCPAPDANITVKIGEGKFITRVDPDRCIACGECIRACKHDARDYIDDTEDAMNAIAREEKLIVMVTPEIKTAFPTKWKGILDWFRSKGCSVYDASFGADICTWAHMRALETGQLSTFITQPCSAVVKYIELYQPKLLTNLSPFHSPVSCSVIYVKEYQRRDNPIAVLSACISKKTEFAETGLVDFSVTYKRLMEYFDRNDIRIASNPVEDYTYKFDDIQGELGSIYSRPGGMRDNLLEHMPDLNVTVSDGTQKVYRELEMYAKMPEQKLPQIFDVLSCEYGCNMGPASGSDQSCFETLKTMHDIEDEARARRKTTGGMFRNTEDKLFRRFDEELKISDFLRSYKPTKPSVLPSDAQLEPIFASMDLITEKERCTDCSACGYKSCRDMATAIFRGLNMPENCIQHTKKAMLSGGGQGGVDYMRFSTELKSAVAGIQNDLADINKTADATGERAKVVNELLRNVVAFCNSNPIMDESSVKQLTGILETTMTALGAFHQNVADTQGSTQKITESIAKLSGFFDALTADTSDEL